eukprot:21011-Chlamydomonas_euryale.AAC.1
MSDINRAGSPTPIVHQQCRELWWFCIHRDIRLKASWIPREENELADFYSKLEDSGDWQLNPNIFQQVQRMWG